MEGAYMEGNELEVRTTSLGKYAERIIRNILRLMCSARDEMDILSRTITDHEKLRAQAFSEALLKQGKTWCTNCLCLFPAAEQNLFLIEDMMDCESVKEIQRICPECRDNNVLGVNIAEITISDVISRGDGYFVRRDGRLFPLGDECYVPVPPVQLMDENAKKFGIQPSISSMFDDSPAFKWAI